MISSKTTSKVEPTNILNVHRHSIQKRTIKYNNKFYSNLQLKLQNILLGLEGISTQRYHWSKG